MPKPQPSEQELLKNILKPLLEDFDYWFGRSTNMLENEKISFLTTEEQADLLKRVKEATQEVSVAKMLFQATSEQVGVEPSTMLTWHKLVSECWQVAMKFRQSQHSRLED